MLDHAKINNSPDDPHITMKQAIAWLTRIGCTDLVEYNECVISGTMADGYQFTTDIREHRLIDTL